MTTLDTLTTLEAAATAARESHRKVGSDSTHNAVTLYESELGKAARNALPALLRVAVAAQDVRAALHLNGVDTEAMRASLEEIEPRLRAALAALEAL